MSGDGCSALALLLRNESVLLGGEGEIVKGTKSFALARSVSYSSLLTDLCGGVLTGVFRLTGFALLTDLCGGILAEVFRLAGLGMVSLGSYDRINICQHIFNMIKEGIESESYTRVSYHDSMEHHLVHIASSVLVTIQKASYK